jgi:two-component system, OmpR family, sensor histidine kinase MprB
VSLRRRIAGAAALAVATVAVILAAVGYLSARSHLVGQIQQELRARAATFVRAHGPGDGGGEPGGGTPFSGTTDSPRSDDNALPANPPLGGAPGYFQFVFPDGRVLAGNGGTPELPVDAQVRQIARQAHGSFYSTATVNGTHVEVLTVGDPSDHKAVQVALPLTSVDDVLHGLLTTYLLVVGAGILLAALLGALIARTALAPIKRFTEQTEEVTSALDRPHRLEETGGEELERLAASFNQTLDALERSVLAQRHLIADASHELRTPMAALRSNIQIFLDAQRLDEQERKELQDSIVAELDELTQLVSDVLQLARGTAPSEHTEPVELDAIVREVVSRTLRRAPQIEFDLVLESTVIVNSPDRVSRAVTNVIDNARKWSPPDGAIEVRLRDGTLTVRDHGPGFNERDIDRVFDRFYRAEQSRRMPGSGLGLAIVKQAAEAHGGSVQAANAPDGGAVVMVSFGPSIGSPREPAPAAQ